MPKVSPLQSNFNGGEFSPLVYGRVDADRYRTGLATCKNYLPTIQGGLIRRSGTYFTAEVKDSSKATRIVRFEFSTTQAYIIEFGNLYCRFYRNNGLITESNYTILNITRADPPVVGINSHPYSNGEEIEISGVVGMTEVNGKRFTVANKTANAFELSGIDSRGYTAYDSGGIANRIYTRTTTYAEADLFDLRFTQSADILYITHPDYAPRKLSRTGHTSWSLSIINFLDGPYLSTNKTATTLTPGAATGSGITVTASAVTGINNNTGFQTTDVGRRIRIKEGSVWGWVKIATRVSTTVVTVNIQSTLTNTNAKSTWRMGEWSDTTGYPAVSTFYEDRLMFAGGIDYPQRLDGSNSGDYENFAPTETDTTVLDSNAVAFTLNSNTVNVVRWLLPDEKGLLVGTTGGEWIVRPSSLAEALSPTNITAKQSTTYGSANVQAVQSGKAALFTQRSGRKIRELRYFFQDDGFEAPDMTLLAEHITESGIKELGKQTEPQSFIWTVRNDGTLVCMTYERDADAVRIGWHRHILGGVSDVAGNPPLVESVAVIPSSDGSKDEVWLLVKRYIDGATVRHIEYITPTFTDDISHEDAFFVDCGLTYDSTATTTISGLHHLEGETLSLLTDGAVHPDVVVNEGAITLNTASSVVHAGYSYNSDGQLLRLEAGAADGTALGKTRRTHRVGMLLYRTLGLKIGMDFDELDTKVFRTSADESDGPPDLFSGIISETVAADYDFDNHFCWRQDQPLPGTILAIMPRMHTQDA